MARPTAVVATACCGALDASDERPVREFPGREAVALVNEEVGHLIGRVRVAQPAHGGPAATGHDALHHVVAMRAEIDLLRIGVPEQACNVSGQCGDHTTS